jgi:hypothetical protein
MNKKQIALIFLSSVLTLSGCERDSSTATPDNSGQFDLILTNGKILTVDDDFTIHDTLVVHEGRVLETGAASLVSKYPAREVIDLQGKTVMPGFNDSHTHIRGRPQRYIELGEVSSIAEIQDLIRSKISEIGEGEWITGYGWSEDELDDGRRPLRDDLDLAAPNNPVILTRAGGHSAVTNSLALDLAGVTLETPQPEGGVIERDDNGELNGIIRERQEIVGRLVPESTYA